MILLLNESFHVVGLIADETNRKPIDILAEHGPWTAKLPLVYVRVVFERGAGECVQSDRMTLRFVLAICLNLENRLNRQLVT